MISRKCDNSVDPDALFVDCSVHCVSPDSPSSVLRKINYEKLQYQSIQFESYFSDKLGFVLIDVYFSMSTWILRPRTSSNVRLGVFHGSTRKPGHEKCETVVSTKCASFLVGLGKIQVADELSSEFTLCGIAPCIQSAVRCSEHF